MRYGRSVGDGQSREAYDLVPCGRYLLERRIALGGMAEVFLAQLPGPASFRKQVVIKRMLEHLRSNEQLASMFVDEARLVARFTHTNLIQVYEFAKIDGQYCLVMEYVEGVDLSDVIERCRLMREPVPETTAAYLISNAAQGLHYAHRLRDEGGQPLNVVHRDISPHNLLVSWEGELKVVDFGVAKYVGSKPTDAGFVKGKFHYMAPEQAAGRQIDARADIYSLGIVLFELLTLQTFYPTGKQAFSLLTHIADLRDNRPRLGEVRIDSVLREIIESMLEPDPEERFQSAEEVIRALESYFSRRVRPLASNVAEYLDEIFVDAKPQAGLALQEHARQTRCDRRHRADQPDDPRQAREARRAAFYQRRLRSRWQKEQKTTTCSGRRCPPSLIPNRTALGSNATQTKPKSRRLGRAAGAAGAARDRRRRASPILKPSPEAMRSTGDSTRQQSLRAGADNAASLESGNQIGGHRQR